MSGICAHPGDALPQVPFPQLGVTYPAQLSGSHRAAGCGPPRCWTLFLLLSLALLLPALCCHPTSLITSAFLGNPSVRAIDSATSGVTAQERWYSWLTKDKTEQREILGSWGMGRTEREKENENKERGRSIDKHTENKVRESRY